MAEKGEPSKDQCLMRMYVQRSKIWSRCVRRGSKRRTKCLICKAREVEEVAGLEEGPEEVEVEGVAAAGNLVVEAGEILTVEALEVEEVAVAAGEILAVEAVEVEEEVVEAAEILAVAVVVVVVEVALAREEEEEEEEERRDKHQDTNNDLSKLFDHRQLFIFTMFYSEILCKTLYYSIVCFLQNFCFLRQLLKRGKQMLLSHIDTENEPSVPRSLVRLGGNN